jgi:hypothetical protein
MGHCDAYPAEHLDSLGDLVDKVILPFVVLVEQQMQLFERRPCCLPVVLLVQITERDRVGEQLVKIFDALHPFSARAMGSFTRWPNGSISRPFGAPTASLDSRLRLHQSNL